MQRVLSWWRGKDHGAPSPGDNSPEIKLHINLPYMMVETKDHVVIDKQCCNIYQPVGSEEGKKYPVIVFVHGGSWRRGDRAHRWFDVYGQNAKILAQAGFVVVVPSYRLSPLAKHPNHCEDIACALKFTAKNIEKYGGDANMVLLMGHSAGGHIISLIALYPQFLTNVGLERSFIKGVVSVSGVYDISAIAKESKVVLKMIVNPAFGVRDDLDYSDASPIEHITPNSPPFLILNAQNDWGLEHQAKHFHEKLKNAGVECEWKHYEGSNTNHLSIIGLGKSLGQPYREMMRDSIKFFQTIVARTSNDFIQDEETVDSIVQDIPINQEQEDDAESESLEVGLMEDGDMAM